MDKIKRIILIGIPTSICNFRCTYCYLSQREESFQGCQAVMQYSPEHVAKALSKERMGGTCYLNFCADGETLLSKNIEQYIYALVKEGHYAEIVTNLTITSVLDKILNWDKEILSRITFKCSFHYLQLKKKNLLDTFAKNVNKIWESGASANIEITPDDTLIPFIDEVKEFSMQHFGALPHLTIARDDNDGRSYLTSLPIEEYDRIWAQFDSDFWMFKKTIFNQPRKEYCYAGKWGMFVDIASGQARQCYLSRYEQNVFDNLDKPIDFIAIGKCRDFHCYNGHALLTLGYIPNFTEVRYGDIRDRVRADGTHWIQPKMLAFLNSKLEESNELISKDEKSEDKSKTCKYIFKKQIRRVKNKLKRILEKFK